MNFLYRTEDIKLIDNKVESTISYNNTKIDKDAVFAEALKIVEQRRS
jgi:hypothetical protein